MYMLRPLLWGKSVAKVRFVVLLGFSEQLSLVLTSAFGAERTLMQPAATTPTLPSRLELIQHPKPRTPNAPIPDQLIRMIYLALTVRNNPTAVAIAPTTEPMA